MQTYRAPVGSPELTETVQERTSSSTYTSGGHDVQVRIWNARAAAISLEVADLNALAQAGLDKKVGDRICEIRINHTR